jgi:hypothetical protein
MDLNAPFGPDDSADDVFPGEEPDTDSVRRAQAAQPAPEMVFNNLEEFVTQFLVHQYQRPVVPHGRTSSPGAPAGGGTRKPSTGSTRSGAHGRRCASTPRQGSRTGGTATPTPPWPLSSPVPGLFKAALRRSTSLRTSYCLSFQHREACISPDTFT